MNVTLLNVVLYVLFAIYLLVALLIMSVAFQIAKKNYKSLKYNCEYLRGMSDFSFLLMLNTIIVILSLTWIVSIPVIRLVRCVV